MKDLKKWTPLILIAFIVIGGIVIGVLLNPDGFVLDETLITNTTTLMIIGGGLLLMIIYYGMKMLKTDSKGGGASGEGITKDGSKISQYYDSRFITEKNWLLSKFHPCTWNTLHKVKDELLLEVK